MKLHNTLATGPFSPQLLLSLVLGIALITGCASKGRPLMPTPVLYQEEPGASSLFIETPAERRRPDVKLFYVTDRTPETNPESSQPYGEGRSPSLTFGTAVVEMVPDLTWEDLKYQSRLPDRSKDVNLNLGKVAERGRFPEEPYELEVTASGLFRSPAVVKQHRKAKAGFESLLRDQLQQSPTKEVVLYVHGFNETFATAAYTMAEICHYLGREHVCGIFTWPASASGNFLTSYNTTAESAIYAVSHLAKTIRMLAQTPGVKSLHILAHSRGAAVMLNSLRELGIETFAAGIEPAVALKIDNIVWIAPDIDDDVARQQLDVFGSNPDMITRWPHDRVPALLDGRMTVYSSPEDKALWISRILFRSRSRVGQINIDETSVKDQRRLKKWGKFDLIIYRGKRTDRFGHAYFVSNPVVSSDLIQLIRYGKNPGDPGRSLKKIGPVAWTFSESDASSAGRKSETSMH